MKPLDKIFMKEDAERLVTFDMDNLAEARDMDKARERGLR